MNAESVPHQEIAFQSDCELLNAAWSLDSGRTVEFRITGHAYERMHPFKRFTQKRAGRVGTRFVASIAHRQHDGMVAVMYHGDAMLKAWGDNSSVGQNFNLWLDDEADRHPFAGYERRKQGAPGELFYVVLVELQDDDTAVDQEKRANAEGKPAPPAHGSAKGRARSGPRKPSAAAHLIVTSAMFVRYLSETRPGLVQKWTPELARKYVKQKLGLESLSQLDRETPAAQRFEDEIRRPYNRWNNQEP